MTPGQCLAFSAGSLFTLALLLGGPALSAWLRAMRRRREHSRGVIDHLRAARARRKL